MEHGGITHHGGFKDALPFFPSVTAQSKQELIQSFDKLFLQLLPFSRAIVGIHYSRNDVSAKGNLGIQFRIQTNYFPGVQVNQSCRQGGRSEVQSYSQHIFGRIRWLQSHDFIPNQNRFAGKIPFPKPGGNLLQQ